MIPYDLHYTHPTFAYLLVGILIFLSLFWRLYVYRSEVLREFASSQVIQAILLPRSRYNYWAKVAAISFVWLMATLALMQPKGNGHYPLGAGVGKAQEEKEKGGVVKRKAHDVIFLVDASASMGVKDTRTEASRLEFAKEIVDEVISQLNGESVALYAFTSDTTKLSPPTLDHLFVRLMLRETDINEGDLAGTNVIEAISDMRDAYLKTPNQKIKTLIVLTDGGDTQLEGLTTEEREHQIGTILSFLNDAKKNNLQVFTIGLGTEQGKVLPGFELAGKPVISSLDENLLKRISKRGGGKYYFANQWTSFDLAEDLVKQMSQTEPVFEELKVQVQSGVARGKEDLIYDLFFQIPLGVSIFFLGFVLFFPDTRIHKVLMCLLFFQSGFIEAQEEILLTRKAEAYFEAKDFPRALELYEGIDEDRLESWQKRRVIYNIGTIELNQGDWEQSGESYGLLTHLPESSFYLSRALSTNRAIRNYRYGKELLNGEELGLENYAKAAFLFRDGLKNLEKAEEAECLFDKFVGKGGCDQPIDLMELKRILKNKLALTLNQYGEAKVVESSLKEGVPLLLSSVKSGLDHLAFMKEYTSQMDQRFQHKYLNLFTRDLESWLLFWEVKLAQQDSLEKAYDFYRKALLAFIDQEWEKSRVAFLSTEASLVQLIQNLWGMDPLIKQLQNLLNSYEGVIVQVPLQVSALYQLLLVQDRVEKVDEVAMQNLERSTEFLKQSLEYARRAKHGYSRFFLQEAMHQIRLLLRYKVEFVDEPEVILENGIEDQSFALVLQRQYEVVSEKEEHLEDFLVDAQVGVMETVQPFIKSVIAKQLREYPERCQCKPWNEVMPLFHQGEKEAIKAQGMINKGQSMLLVMKYQELAIKFWREALDKLRQPEEAPPQEIAEEPEEKTSMNEIMKLLQQMDADDRIPEPSDKKPQQGQRPW